MPHLIARQGRRQSTAAAWGCRSAALQIQRFCIIQGIRCLTEPLAGAVGRPPHEGGDAAQAQPHVVPEGVVSTLPRHPVAHQNLQECS